MEPVTHILTGACLSRSGLSRRAAYATLTMALAARISLISTLCTFCAAPSRAFSTIAASPIPSLRFLLEAYAIMVGAVYVLHRVPCLKRAARARLTARSQILSPKPLLRWGLLYGFALLALLSHLLLDFTPTATACAPFLPFNPHWYAGSFVFIFDPLIFLFCWPWRFSSLRSSP